MSRLFFFFFRFRFHHAISAFFFVSILSFLFPCLGYSELNIDGRIDEPEWKDAQTYEDFVVIDPYTFDSPHLPTQAKVMSLPEGLAVAFVCEHPAEEPRTRTGTIPDAQDFNSDFISLMVDFDGTGGTVYEFSVSLAGSYRDGTYTAQNRVNYNWDGIWKRGVHEEADRWMVELLLPWSIVSMREGDGDTRQLGVYFQRGLNSRNEVSAFPALDSGNLPFASEFEKIEVAEYSEQQLDISPYVSVISDLVSDSTTTKAGGDLFWKPNGKFQLALTANPDFGQVESDELVINFSATETFFSDKRPFFTENISLFTVPITHTNSIFHTRRVGGPSDDGEATSDIDAAVKVMGTINTVNYGLFAAQEADDAGRSFYAGRISVPMKKGNLGWLSTYADRPHLDRTALVNTLDYSLALNRLFARGVFIRSDVDDPEEDSSGYAGYAMFEYEASERLRMMVSQLYIDDTVNWNDMGYMQRNDYTQTFGTMEFTQKDFPEDSPTTLVTWRASTFQRFATNGDRLPSNNSFSRKQQFQSGASLQADVSYGTSGYNNIISRGNGKVYQDPRWNGSLSYATQRRGLWRKSIRLRVFQQGVDGWSVSLDGSASFYPRENLSLDVSVKPSRSNDWLRWLEDDLLASYSTNEMKIDMTAAWFPAEKHEVRLRTQWVVIDAEAEQGYRINPDNHRLIPSDDVIDKFAATNFGLQFRYRYEIAPLSDFYFVYSRGGRDYIDNPDENTWDLLEETTSLRDSDQIVMKLRYRF